MQLKSDEIKTTWNCFEEDGREGERETGREKIEREKGREGEVRVGQFQQFFY